jgi:antibiotic biosynthesis monooxygenase (ABM) superfamily enzyme
MCGHLHRSASDGVYDFSFDVLAALYHWVDRPQRRFIIILFFYFTSEHEAECKNGS